VNRTYQTIFGNKKGNCFAACFASIFEIPLEEIPNFVDVKESWWKGVVDWCAEHGVFPFPVDVEQSKKSGWGLPPGYTILSGKSPRGDWLHSVVARGGTVVHDPHPSCAGLEDIQECLVFIVLDPALCAQRRT